MAVRISLLAGIVVVSISFALTAQAESLTASVSGGSSFNIPGQGDPGANCDGGVPDGVGGCVYNVVAGGPPPPPGNDPCIDNPAQCILPPANTGNGGGAGVAGGPPPPNPE